MKKGRLPETQQVLWHRGEEGYGGLGWVRWGERERPQARDEKTRPWR